MKKLAFVDLETTGLDPDKNVIIEIGCFLVDGDNLSAFQCQVKPSSMRYAEPEALKLNGYNEEEWFGAMLMPNALRALNTFVGTDVYFIAYNATFDWPFLAKAYDKYGVNNPFHYHRLDVMTLAWHLLPPGHSLSLKNVCKYFNLPVEPSMHRALNGARCAYEVYKTIKERHQPLVNLNIPHVKQTNS